MALNAKKIQGGNRPQQANVEAGVYPARVVQILDMGLQPQRPYLGEDKPPAQEIMLTYELVDEFMKDEDGEDIVDKPRWISETMPLRAFKNEKAKSTIRLKAFDPKDDFDGDITKAIGIPVNVTIVNNPGQGDKIYDNVANVAAMRPRDAATCPELKNDSKLFVLDDPDMEVFVKLPKWIQEKISGNLEFKGSALEKALGGVKKEEKKDEPAKPKQRKQAEQEDPPFEADGQDEDMPY